MLSIRFSRVGRKKSPSYRIVIMDKRKDPWANFKEKLGFYNPKTKETTLNKERILYWIKQGAQASETVHNLLVKNGVISGNKKKSVKITKTRAEKMNKEKEDKIKAETDKKASADAKALADKQEEADKIAAEEAKKAEEAKPEETVESSATETPTETKTEETPKTE